MKLLIACTFVFLLALSPVHTGAAESNYAYLYIQGDKSIPFYVKINGVMQPRYSKNYCIVSKLEGGKVDVEILFQQNAYPARHFIIDVPAKGRKGFLLNRKADTFSLYDIEMHTNINPENN